MNPYVLLALVLAWAGSAGGAFWYGTAVGRDGELATQAREEKVRRETFDAAQAGAASAIAKIEVKNVTINRKLETVVRDQPVFRDCRSGADSVRIFNSGIPGWTDPSGGGQLPAKGAAGR